MQRAFDFLEQGADVVQAQSRAQPAEVVSPDAKGLPALGRGPIQALPQGVVDHISERASGSARQPLQLGRDIVIERQRGPHILMLGSRHHDVKPLTPQPDRPGVSVGRGSGGRAAGVWP